MNHCFAHSKFVNKSLLRKGIFVADVVRHSPKKYYHMKTSTLFLYSLLLFSYSTSHGQVGGDTLASHEASSVYQFHLNLSPQEGYGIVLGLHGGLKDEKPRRFIYEFGIAKTTRLQEHEGGILERYASFEINEIDEKLIYGFVVGVDAKQFGNFGVSLNYMTNFSSLRAVTVRPSFGFMLMPIASLYATFGYDIPILKPNFDIINHWLGELRCNIGFLERKQYGAQQPQK